MIIIKARNPLNNKPYFDSSAVTVGNFDGFHRGHAELCAITKEISIARSCTAAVLTFEPHPDAYFGRNPNIADELLFTPEQRLRAFSEAQMDAAVLLKFDELTSQQSHTSFFHDVVETKLNAQAIVVGNNFRFGKGRLGDYKYLCQAGDESHILVRTCSPIEWDQEAISSTRIRKTLRNDGNAELAAELLGRPYLVEGTIRRGDQLGRSLGFPTANLHEIRQLIPRNGVYCGFIWLEGPASPSAPMILSRDSAALPCVINVGFRPSVASGQELRCEAHVLDSDFASDELYDRRAGIYFVKRLRDEQKFPDTRELQKAIRRDVDAAREFFTKSASPPRQA